MRSRTVEDHEARVRLLCTAHWNEVHLVRQEHGSTARVGGEQRIQQHHEIGIRLSKNVN